MILNLYMNPPKPLREHLQELTSKLCGNPARLVSANKVMALSLNHLGENQAQHSAAKPSDK